MLYISESDWSESLFSQQIYSRYSATLGLPSEINIAMPQLNPKLSFGKDHRGIESLLKNMMGFTQDGKFHPYILGCLNLRKLTLTYAS